jgi:hypothetical protein
MYLLSVAVAVQETAAAAQVVIEQQQDSVFHLQQQ